MRVLVTTSRMPCAIDEIRKLGERGHQVIATDTFRSAPGSHSRHVERALLTASPTHATSRFIEQIASIVRDEHIDLILPAFEEVFYLAKHEALLPSSVGRFFSRFEVLETLHDKTRFLGLARDLGLLTPRSAVATSQEELRAATREFPSFFAKPVFSRGGVDLCTNKGPLAGALPVEACEASEDRPWIVQEFVEGLDVCTFSVVHHGRLTGHSAYVHPREIEHAGGIVFESVHEPACLEAAGRIAEATGYHGQLSFDFLKTAKGMVLIECNPRPTAGVHVMHAEDLEDAILDRHGKLRVAPAGVRRKYSIALLRDMLLHFGEAREDLRYLLSDAKEVVADPEDIKPAFFQALSYGHVLAYRLHHAGKSLKKRTLMAAYFEDVLWNGGSIK